MWGQLNMPWNSEKYAQISVRATLFSPLIISLKKRKKGIHQQCGHCNREGVGRGERGYRGINGDRKLKNWRESLVFVLSQTLMTSVALGKS